LGQLLHRPQERLLPMIVSAAYTAPMPIMKATAAPTRPLTRMERRVSNGS